MSIETRKTILSFLAERYPAAYKSVSITQRVNRSGLLDAVATEAEVLSELRLLANRFSQVSLLVDAVGDQYWGATTGGVSAWQLDGALHVGG